MNMGRKAYDVASVYVLELVMLHTLWMEFSGLTVKPFVGMS